MSAPLMGVASGGVRGCPWPTLLQDFFNQTTHNWWRKCHDDILAIVKKPFFLNFFFDQSIDEIIITFATRHPRRLLLKGILKDEQWELN